MVSNGRRFSCKDRRKLTALASAPSYSTPKCPPRPDTHRPINTLSSHRHMIRLPGLKPSSAASLIQAIARPAGPLRFHSMRRSRLKRRCPSASCLSALACNARNSSAHLKTATRTDLQNFMLLQCQTERSSVSLTYAKLASKRSAKPNAGSSHSGTRWYD